MRIVLTGGGTGGHIYPALAIGTYMKEQNSNTQLLFIGTEKGLESKIVPQAGIRFETINITGFKRKLSYDNVRTVIRFFQGVKRSKKLLKEFKPDVVVGTGGYVCGPVVYAAARLGIPTFLHEQNAIPGLTNKFLMSFVSHVGVSFEDSMPYFRKAKQLSYTGNPCGTSVLKAVPGAGRKSLDFEPNQKYVLAAGGSRGARVINEAVIGLANEFEDMTCLHGMKLVLATGEVNYEATLERIKDTHAYRTGQIIVKPYIHNMSEVLTDSSLFIGRSGASFLAEITALGKPSILIPSPYVTNNHQEANASSLVQVGAAVMVLEQEVNTARISTILDELTSSEHKRNEMSKAAKFLSVPDSASRIALAINRIIK